MRRGLSARSRPASRGQQQRLYLRPEPQWHGCDRDSFGSGFSNRARYHDLTMCADG